ncbi:hypothetical protein [Promicromonospora sp. NPDC060271]|uniref:hypothetical protein n=1 Tax=Promicromonospora sp. NPDC060271 TaxID=3347089 RepID=UPI003649510D
MTREGRDNPPHKREGRRWAWWALLAGLGVLGLASMVVPMAADLAAGSSWYHTLGGDVSPVLPAIRVVHIAFVVAGVVTMLQPRVRLSLDGAGRPGRTATVRAPGAP